MALEDGMNSSAAASSAAAAGPAWCPRDGGAVAVDSVQMVRTKLRTSSCDGSWVMSRCQWARAAEDKRACAAESSMSELTARVKLAASSASSAGEVPPPAAATPLQPGWPGWPG